MKTSEQYTVILIKIVAIVALIALIVLTSCAPVKKESQTLNPIADAKNIGRALGCVFGGCDRATQDREFQREFEKIDKSSQPKK